MIDVVAKLPQLRRITSPRQEVPSVEGLLCHLLHLVEPKVEMLEAVGEVIGARDVVDHGSRIIPEDVLERAECFWIVHGGSLNRPRQRCGMGRAVADPKMPSQRVGERMLQAELDVLNTRPGEIGTMERLASCVSILRVLRQGRDALLQRCHCLECAGVRHGTRGKEARYGLCHRVE